MLGENGVKLGEMLHKLHIVGGGCGSIVALPPKREEESGFEVWSKFGSVPMLCGMSTLGKPLLEVGALGFLQRAWAIEDCHSTFFCS